MTAASNKQVRFAVALMERAGIGIRRVETEHLVLGAPPSRAGKSVDGWLASMTSTEIGRLIDALKERTS